MQPPPSAPPADGSRRRLDQLIRGLRERQTPSAAIPRRPAGDARAPASFAQRRMWLLDRLAPGSPAYNLPGLLHLEGELKPAALQAALAEIARRHEALRTIFEAEAGEPFQRILPPSSWLLPVVDLAALPTATATATAELALQARREARHAFDLARGPLLHTVLFRLGRARHALLLVFHHAIADGWSLEVFLGELAALYGALAEGRPARLPELPVQLADHAFWQRQVLSEARLRQELEYWRAELAELPALELPADRSVPARLDDAAGHARCALGVAPTARLRALARRAETTPFVVFLAAFGALLGRLAGQDELGVGTAVAGRRRRELEGLIGFFANTLVLRLRLAGAPSFETLVQRARSVLHDSDAHQELPFERLVEALRPERELGELPLVRALLTLEPALLPRSAGGLRIVPEKLRGGTAKLDLTLFLEDRSEDFVGTLEFRRSRFDATTLRRWCGHLEVLLGAALADPALEVAALPLLAPAQRAQLVAEHNDTAVERREWPTIHGLVAASARRRPDAIALEAEDDAGVLASLSYAELARRAHRLAALLRARGVGTESAVAILAGRGLAMVEATLGVLEAGGFFVPLDPGYPADRLAWMLADVGAELVLAERALAGVLSAGVAEVLRIEDCVPARGEPPAGAPVGDADQLAYVMYTSGSTGQPKGVAVRHRGVVRLVDGARFARLDPDVVFLHAAPTSFDAATLELWGPLASGGRVALAPPRPLSLDELGAVLERRKVCSAWLTAGLFHLMVEGRLERLRGLRQLLAGGDVLSVPHVARALARLPATTLVNGYGPTENTTFTCCSKLRPEDGRAASVPIGRPIAATRALLLDRRLEPVPIGVAGQLCAAGEGLARGYFRRPGPTAAVFVPDPTGVERGARLYLTGDRARWLADGRIEFLGRIDRQLKLRGFRIEPGEIEAALLARPGVRAAAVVVRGGTAVEQRRLVAFVVGDEPRLETGDALRERLGEHLPAPLVPAQVVWLDALPLNANGKIDRGALARRPLEVEPMATGEPARMRTPSEQRLAEIWAELLDVDPAAIAADLDFFSLGGHSLRAAQVLARVRDVFGVEVPLARFFEAPTLPGLAAAIEMARERAGTALPRAPDTLPPPISFAQERAFFLWRLDPGSAAYNMPARVRLLGELAQPALAAALSAVVARHEPLRARFAERAGAAAQTIAAPQPVPLPVIDLARVAAAETDRLARAQAARPFDLERGPLLRATLLRLAPREHALLLVIHHVAADGWSVGVLARELGALYSAAVGGAPALLPELRTRYRDYAAAQRRELAAGRFEPQLAAWRARLAGVPALELPADHPVSAAGGERGAVLPLRLDPELSAALGRFAGGERATLFMVLLAVWQALLGRLAGQNDFAVGAPIAGRRRVELEPLVGFFVNTLVLRADLGGDPSFCAHLAATRERVLEADAHQDLPFERLVEVLAPERELASTPLFQVMLAFQNAPLAPARLAGLEVGWEEVPSGAAKFELTLALEERDGVLRGGLEYRRDRFDPTTVQRWRSGFETLLRSALAAPERRLGELALLGPAARHALCCEHADTEPTAPASLPLDVLIAEQTARTPERIALAFRGGRLSYGELRVRAGGLAGRLRALAVGPETRVGVCLERGPELVVALLAIHAAGGAYVPLDPLYPPARLALMLEDSAAALVLTRSALRERLPAAVCPVLCLDGEPADGQTVPAPAVGVERLSHLIYTSGSTGRPKGVAIGQRAAAALIAWARGCFGAEELEGMLAATSICFDLSVFEIFVPLAAGGTVVLAENALELAEHPDRERVRLLNTVPSAAAELARAGGLPRSVATVGLAGEPLRRVLVETLAAAGAARVWNLYGPSEDTTYSTAVRVPLGIAEEPTIGRPIPGSSAWVLDRGFHLLPLGVVGELGLGGAGLARGYLGRPALTAERFVPDALSGAPGERLYRTGDRVRRRADGELVFLGRLDQQVKVRGFRIEPGEVETRLLEHPAVEAAAVLALPDAAGTLGLIAWVVPAALDLEGLRGHLAARLPAHMVPGRLVAVAALPQTASGKLDRKTLAATVATLTAATLTAAAPEDAGGWRPRTPVEEILAALWHELLGTRVDGPEAHFFHLGGHSLLAGRVVARVREALGVELALRQVFELPRLGALAAAVERLRAAGRAALLPPLVAAPRPERLPLSFAQERMWLLDRFEPGPLYHLPAALVLRGELGVAALRAALAEIVRRHEVLRTRLVSTPEGPRQVVDPPPGPDAALLPKVDLERLDPAARPALERALLSSFARRPFELAAGALVRFGLVRKSAGEHTLGVVFHHAAADGWSLGVLTSELEALYAAALAGRASPLAELPVQIADFALWQRAWLTGARLEGDLEVWRRRLAGLQPLELPSDRPRPPVKGVRGATVTARLPAERAAALRALARAHDATLFMTLLAGFQTLLLRITGADEVTVGTPVAGRSRLELEGMIGFFVNTLVLRSELAVLDAAADPSFASLLAHVRERALEAWAHQELPFEQLVGEVAPRRDLSRTPLFQVAFALQDGLDRPPRLPGLEVEVREIATATAKFDLTLTVVDSRDTALTAAIEYDRELFDATTMRRWLAALERVLAAVSQRPALRLSRLPLLGAAERWQLVGECNDTARPLVPGTVPGTVLEPIAERLRAAPWALALTGGGERWSYGELARRSGALAARLRQLGAAPETIVAVCAERSPALIAAQLGVLRSGAAYLPLDPAHPPERLAYMLGDARARVLVVERALAARFAGCALPIVVLEELEPAAMGFTAPSGAEPSPHPESLAYVIYTSGSTGRPKGVAICQRTLAGLVRWHVESFGVSAADRATQLAGPGFDASVWEVWPYLAAGASLHVAPEQVRAAPAELAGWLVAEAITHSFLPTPLAEAVLARDWPAGAALRILLTGGDRLQTRPRAEHRFELHNFYGPTENTVLATGARVEPAGEGPPAIGRPVAGVRAVVVDPRLGPVPLGCHGELVIGGAALARGYLGRPGLTAERFVPDPFAAAQGARLYRSGDLVRRRGDGSLDFLGRIDHQVKVRGYRIELGEIEAVLAEHPALSAAAVVVLGGGGDARLVACGVARSAVEPSELRAWLGRRLPEHMVPTACLLVESLPLTANGKVDRAGLARVAAAAGASTVGGDRPYAPPEAPLERALAAVWARILGSERVGLDDNFFELGGDSLKMARLVEAVSEVLGRKVAVVDGFRYPTVRALAGHLGQTAGGQPPAAERELLREAQQAAEMRREARGSRRDRRLGLR